MKIKFTIRDFVLLVGILVAGLLIVASIFYRDLLTLTPGAATRKGITTACIKTVTPPANALAEEFAKVLSRK